MHVFLPLLPEIQILNIAPRTCIGSPEHIRPGRCGIIKNCSARKPKVKTSMARRDRRHLISAAQLVTSFCGAKDDHRRCPTAAERKTSKTVRD